MLCLLAAAFGATSALAGEHIEKTVMILAGANAGFQQATYADDGSLKVHFEFNDRGRGPKLDSSYTLDAKGLPVTIALKGVDYLKASVDETFTTHVP